jgi:hypothetical protein
VGVELRVEMGLDVLGDWKMMMEVWEVFGVGRVGMAVCDGWRGGVDGVEEDTEVAGVVESVVCVGGVVDVGWKGLLMNVHVVVFDPHLKPT